LQREWALFAVRSLCADNVRNQAAFAAVGGGSAAPS